MSCHKSIFSDFRKSANQNPDETTRHSINGRSALLNGIFPLCTKIGVFLKKTWSPLSTNHDELNNPVNNLHKLPRFGAVKKYTLLVSIYFEIVITYTTNKYLCE